MATIAVIGTLDTKGEELAWLARAIRERGHQTLLVDLGTGSPPILQPDLSREAVLQAAGGHLEEVLLCGDRGRCVEAMAHAAPVVMKQWFEEGKIVEIQALWDIPELMMQANAWPMAPSLGLEYHVPGPATLDGQVHGPWNEERSKKSCDLVIEMLDHMKRHPSQGEAEVMQMPKFWHPRMNWYGPAGIGTGRGIAGFRNWHQIPFLNAMPDRGRYNDEIVFHFFGDDEYAAVTGWPDMIQTVTNDGWMGIAPAGKKITMCSLDFWRIEDGLIRENWVLLDLLDVYYQLGVDVFKRLKEFNKARILGRISPTEAFL